MTYQPKSTKSNPPKGQPPKDAPKSAPGAGNPPKK